MASTTAAGSPSRRSLALPPAIVANGGSAIAIRWILSRALTLSILVFARESDVSGDVGYYARSLHQLFSGVGLSDTLQEYPLPVLALLVPQFVLGFLNQVAFTVLFVISMLTVDAVFTGFLWRGDGRRRGDAANLWLWFVPAIGPLAYFRFDLVPAVLAGGAVLVAVRRPALAGALTAIGASLKLWPAVMLPTFLIRRADRRPVLLGFLGTGIGLAVLSLIVGGYDRLVSPVQWQTARGLQVESISATPLMVARMLHHASWQVGLSRYKAFEIFGPGVHLFNQLASLLTVLAGALLVLLWWRAHNHPSASAETLGWLFLATALLVTVTNKTLSPQYLLWLGGPTAALAVRSPRNRAVRTFSRLLLIAALLTQIVYPIGYNQMIKDYGASPVVTLILAARNGLLVWLAYYACRQVWRLSDGIRTGAETNGRPL